MADLNTLCTHIKTRFASWITDANIALGELTVTVKSQHLLDLCLLLRDEAEFGFAMLIDVCGVDYLQYGVSDWETESSTVTGFSRGVLSPELASASSVIASSAFSAGRGNPDDDLSLKCATNRFAVVYHLLSLSNNHRLRLRIEIPEQSELIVDSVMEIWPAANWFEREVFDLFGILFRGHPDLRRILTDYGFVGHPFRKDFPLIGKVEVRYDAALKRVVYEPVSIEPRILEPKVIREDHRYQVERGE